jgi:glutaredoxin-like protein NrdH
MLSEKMNSVKIPGKNKKHKVLLYALSTCAWCKKTKRFLKENEIEYEYVDVDLCDEEDQEKITNDILSKGGRLSYPATIVDNKILVNGFQVDKIKEALEI